MATVQESSDFESFKSIFYYSFIIIIFPVLSFFTAKFIVFNGSESLSSNISSAAIAVIVLHFSVGMFIYKAYSESSTKPAKQD